MNTQTIRHGDSEVDLWYEGDEVVAFRMDNLGFVKRYEHIELDGAEHVENFDYRLDGVLTLIQLL